MNRLLNFNEKEYNKQVEAIMDDARKVQPVLDALKERFKIEINNDTLRDILNNNSTAIKAKIRNEVEVQFNRAGITLTSILTASLDNELKSYESITEPLELISTYSKERLTVVNGKVEISETAKEHLKQMHSYYLQSDRAVELREAHLKLGEAIQRFLELSTVSPYQINQTFYMDEGKVKVHDLYYNSILAQDK